MRHQKSRHNFASSESQRKSILKNLTKDLLMHEHVTTTKARARVLRSYAESLISKMSDDLNGKKYLESQLGKNKKLEEKVIEDYLKRYENDNSGFIEVFKIGFRKGDGAELIRLVMKGYTPEKKSKLTKVGKKDSEKVEKKTKATTKMNIGKEDSNKGQVNATDVKQRAKSRSGI